MGSLVTNSTILDYFYAGEPSSPSGQAKSKGKLLKGKGESGKGKEKAGELCGLIKMSGCPPQQATCMSTPE